MIHYNIDEFRKWMLETRGLTEESACPVCKGVGKRHYGHSSTWRGGMGVPAFSRAANDVCDRCWGSGSKYEKWLDLRQLQQEKAAWEADQCARWFAYRAGITYKHLRPALLFLVAELKRIGNKRKVPAGVNLYDLQVTTDVLAATLEKMAKKED